MPEGKGIADPIYTCELALELGMTVRQLGREMDVYELTVIWPEFFAYRQREAKRRQQEADMQSHTPFQRGA